MSNNAIRDLQGKIHSSTNSGDFMATGVGDNSFQSQITGLLDTGDANHVAELTNHIGREYFRRLDQFGLTPSNPDDLDVGFRPLTFTGLYAAP